jgi:FkbM family methyltransferase
LILSHHPTARKILLRTIRLATWILALFVLAPSLLVRATPEGTWLYRAEKGLRLYVALPRLIIVRHPACPLSETVGRIGREYMSENHTFEQEAAFILVSDHQFSNVHTPLGEFWIPARDLRTLFEMVDEQQRAIYEHGAVRVRPGDIVLDCGANVGVTVRAELARGAGLVVAIEPASAPLDCLRRNLASELQQGKVIIYPRGVWDRDAELELTNAPNSASTTASVAIQLGQPVEKIRLTTIDRIVQELHLQRVDFIKMDIEGSEGPALQGALHTVAAFHPRMAISLEHRPTDPDTLPALVHRLWPGYETICGPCEWQGTAVQPNVMFAQFVAPPR